MMQEQDDPILAKARELRKAGASIEQVKQYLQSKGYDVGQPVRAEPTGPRKLMRAPSDATAALQRERPNASGDFEATAPAIAANIASATQIIPGMEAVQAGASMLANRMPYREALAMQRGETNAIPGPIKFAEQMVVGAPFAAALPASPVVSGAIVGGADQLLDADPDKGVGERAVRGAAGATIGAGVGAALDALVTKGRSLKAEPSSKIVRRLKAERSATSGPMYGQAIIEGQGKTATDPDVAMFLAQPDVQEIVKGLKQTRKFSGVADDSPEMLDAVYKVLSDQGAAAKRGLEAVTPNRPNIGRFRLEDIRTAKNEALNAMDATMPSYRPAVQSYADYSGKIGAVRQGQEALRTGLQKGVTTGKNLDRTTFEAFEDAMQKLTPEERELAMKGILGGVKQAARSTSPIRSAGTLLKAPRYLRATKTAQQRAFDTLIKAALLGGSASIIP